MSNIYTPMVQFTGPHPGQETILNAKARFRVVACGRRFGKTEMGKIALAKAAMDGATCWWLDPTYNMAMAVWRDLKVRLRHRVPGLVISESDHRIDIPGAGSIGIRSTHNPDHLRGMGLDFAILDEAAFMPPTVWPEVVRPMLLERRGRAMFLSTPRGRNWFFDLFTLGFDPEEPDWAAFHFTSYDNPLIAREEIDAIRRTTPERVFAAEYMAEFSDEAGQVFRGVRRAATAPIGAMPRPDRIYVAGVDWGREFDYTVIAVIDAVDGQMVALDRFNAVSWSAQRGRLMAIAERWQPAVIWAEANSIGSVNIEALQNEGLPVRAFHTTASSKGPLIDGLALAIERQEIALLPDEVLLNELQAYAMTRLPGGGYRYSAPSGGHDDTVIAAALAWHGLKHGGIRVDFA